MGQLTGGSWIIGQGYCQGIAILFENMYWYWYIGIATTFSSIRKSNFCQYQYRYFLEHTSTQHGTVQFIIARLKPP